MQIPAVINEIFTHVLLGNGAVGRWLVLVEIDNICLDRFEDKGLRQGSLEKQSGLKTNH